MELLVDNFLQLICRNKSGGVGSLRGVGTIGIQMLTDKGSWVMRKVCGGHPKTRSELLLVSLDIATFVLDFGK